MTDATSNRFQGRGTAAAMAAFVPNPATPASGPDQGYTWWNTDDNTLYAYDFVGVAWVATGGGGLTLSDSTLAGRGDGSGSGAPEEITLGPGLAMTGTVLDTTGGGGGALEGFLLAAACGAI